MPKKRVSNKAASLAGAALQSKRKQFRGGRPLKPTHCKRCGFPHPSARAAWNCKCAKKIVALPVDSS